MKAWLRERARYIREETQRDFAVAVLIETPKGIPLVVRSRSLPNPLGGNMFVHSSKFPGGKGQLRESQIQAVIREIFEELGMRIDPSRLVRLYSEVRKAHDFHAFGIFSSEVPSKTKTDADETVVMVSVQTLLENFERLPPGHYEAAEAWVRRFRQRAKRSA